jgi:adenosylcobyric acid synthase
VTRGASLARPAIRLDDGADGALSEDGCILATYVHGLFDRAEACAALLAWAGLERPVAVDRASRREAALERLADCVEERLALDRLRPFF